MNFQVISQEGGKMDIRVNPMSASELAKTMLEWEEVKRRLDLLTRGIEEAVLALGKTQVVGAVRASYSAGRKSYDYEGAAAKAIPPADWPNYQKPPAYDWKAACEDKGLEVPFTQAPPSVTVKLEE
jgi:hypothetical protein